MINTPIKIGIMGKFRSGKDTVADYLVSKHNFLPKFEIASMLKTTCKNFYPEQFENGAKPRELLQRMGVHLRNFDEDIHINACLKEIEEWTNVLDSRDGIVVPGVRFPNEVKRLKEEGFIIVKVVAPRNVIFERAVEAGDKSPETTELHESEMHVDTLNADYTFYNVDTLESLYAQVDDLIEFLRGV